MTTFAMHTDRMSDDTRPSAERDDVPGRRRAMELARHSTVMEGGRSSDAARAIQEEWIRGDIDAAELVARTRALHGLPHHR